MSKKQNKKLVRRFYAEVINERDVEATDVVGIAELMSQIKS